MEVEEEHQEDVVDSALVEEAAPGVVEVSPEEVAVALLLEEEEVQEEDFPAVVAKSPLSISVFVSAFGLCMVFRVTTRFCIKKNFCHTSLCLDPIVYFSSGSECSKVPAHHRISQ